MNGAVTKKTTAKKLQPISTVQERKQWLNACNDFLAKTSETLSDKNNLFLYEESKEEKVLIELPVVKEEQKYADELVVLQKVGDAIKPEGKLVIGGKFALCLHGSKIITTKTIIKAKTKDHTFKITVKDITKNQFILQLKQHTLTFNY